MTKQQFSKKDICRLFEITESEFDSMLSKQDEIKKRYRKIAKKLHPDNNPTECQDEYNKKFVEIGEAYKAFLNYEEIVSATSSFEYEAYKGTYTENQGDKSKQTTYEKYNEQPEEQSEKNFQEYEKYAYTYTRRYGWKKFWWLFFWPVRGLLCGLGTFFINFITWISAVISLGAFIGVPVTIIWTYRYFHDGIGDVSKILMVALGTGIAILIFWSFQRLEESREDWNDKLWQWWRL